MHQMHKPRCPEQRRMMSFKSPCRPATRDPHCIRKEGAVALSRTRWFMEGKGGEVAMPKRLLVRACRYTRKVTRWRITPRSWCVRTTHWLAEAELGGNGTVARRTKEKGLTGRLFGISPPPTLLGNTTVREPVDRQTGISSAGTPRERTPFRRSAMRDSALGALHISW